MGDNALYTMSREGRESRRDERILVLPLRTRKSPLLDQRQLSRISIKNKNMPFNFLHSCWTCYLIWNEYKILCLLQGTLWFNLYVLFVRLYIVVISCCLTSEQTGFELYSFDKRYSCIWQICSKCLQCIFLQSPEDPVVNKAK